VELYSAPTLPRTCHRDMCRDTFTFNIMTSLVRNHTGTTSVELLVRKYLMVSKNRQLSTETSVTAGIHYSFHLMIHDL